MKKVPLSYPLPKMQWHQSPGGRYCTEWDPKDLERAKKLHFKYVYE